MEINFDLQTQSSLICAIIFKLLTGVYFGNIYKSSSALKNEELIILNFSNILELDIACQYLALTCKVQFSYSDELNLFAFLSEFIKYKNHLHSFQIICIKIIKQKP